MITNDITKQNQEPVWLAVTQVVELTGLAPRTVQLRCQKGIYATRTVDSQKGKTRYEVALSSLDEKYQKKYAPIRLKAASHVSLKDLKEWQRDAAFKRLEILLDWEKYEEEKQMGISLVADEFCAKMRKEKGIRLSKSTLYRWKKAVKNNMADLAPKWNNGREKFQDDKFSPEAKKFAHDIWLHPNRPTMKEGWFQTKKKAEANMWRIPSFGTFKRFYGAIPRPVVIKHRQGKKKFDDYALPSIFRDYEDPNLEPMKIIVGDHHQLDVACIFPDSSRGFPWMTTWMDAKSRKPLAWTLCKNPSSDSINISFQDLVLQYGVPHSVLLDNGRDYKSKIFVGEKGRIDEENITVNWERFKMEGIYKELGVKTIFAIPRNAKAKPIERMFLTVINGFSVYWRGFRGRDTKQRPEDLNANWKDGNLPTFEEVKQGLAGYINFYNEERQHRGHGMNERTPNDVFFAGLKTKRAVKPEELALLCSRKGTATITQNGLYLFNDWYRGAEIMFKYQGRKVRYLYNEDDITKVFVFTLEGQFIGIAEKYNRAQWNMDSDEYAKHMRWKKTVKESTKAWEEENIPERMSGIDREGIILSRSARKKEPALAAEVYETKYAQLVEEFNSLQQKREETHELLKKHSMRLAGFKGNEEKDREMRAKVESHFEQNSKIDNSSSTANTADKVKEYFDKKGPIEKGGDMKAKIEEHFKRSSKT